MDFLLKKILGSKNARTLKKLRALTNTTSALAPEIAALSDEALQGKTDHFKRLLGEGKTLDAILPEVFATVREASVRTLGMRHFDVQLIGAMALHQGKIAEMRTGEGKTLAATLAVYLNALSGKGVHVITVNDYLARRDAEWMGRLYRFLGLSVGVISSQMPQQQLRDAYAADITYGTNNAFGFDYLRDNLVMSMDDKVQRGLNFAIIDEVDSILIDEARTPLVISGAASGGSELYAQINQLIPHLQANADETLTDYTLDEKSKQAFLAEHGHERVEQLLIKQGVLADGENLYDPRHIGILHHINAALRAHFLYQRDVDYLVLDGQVVIIDEFTGRTMAGRRWSDGLHQAIEAKEGVIIQQENHTVASITFQNYFLLYEKLAGMTGTADTEAFEFQQIYHLDVVVIPTHQHMIRADHRDLIYLTAEDKFNAIIEDVIICHQRQQPVLIGTASVEVSELLASILKKRGLKHEVLNAKQHEREAQIISNAGLPGAITIATNMAGRGTDIVLGGNLELELAAISDADEAALAEAKTRWEQRHQAVVTSGGLYVIGTERHESRRIDNQLRGRSGRQGDPGASRFYLSFDDNLMRIFASEKLTGMMKTLGMQKGEAIEHRWVSKAIYNAQRRVEAHNFDIRKHLLDYDNVANVQRQAVYKQRDELLVSEDISSTLSAMRRDLVQDILGQLLPVDMPAANWDLEAASAALERQFGQRMPLQDWVESLEQVSVDALVTQVLESLDQHFQLKEDIVGTEPMRGYERHVFLQCLDMQWREHLVSMDYLRNSMGLRSYAQKQPIQEYKREAYEMFSTLLESVKRDVVELLAKVEVRKSEEVADVEPAPPLEQYEYAHQDMNALATPPAEPEPQKTATPYTRQNPKVGRNDPCWCGSEKKYKHCHGKGA